MAEEAAPSLVSPLCRIRAKGISPAPAPAGDAGSYAEKRLTFILKSADELRKIRCKMRERMAAALRKEMIDPKKALLNRLECASVLGSGNIAKIYFPELIRRAALHDLPILKLLRRRCSTLSPWNGHPVNQFLKNLIVELERVAVHRRGNREKPDADCIRKLWDVLSAVRMKRKAASRVIAGIVQTRTCAAVEQLLRDSDGKARKLGR